MKTRLPSLLFVAALLLSATALLAAAPLNEDTKTGPANEKPVLHVVIEDFALMGENAVTDYDRMALGIERVAKERGWPVKIKAERLGGTTHEYDTALWITLQARKIDPGAVYVFRATTTLVLNGQKHDFGTVRFDFNRHLGRFTEDVYAELFNGGAAAIADQIEPLLFPGLKPSK